MEIYGAAVADRLDNNRGILRRRYYRQHCTPEMGSYTKDLSAICSDLTSVFILDNSPGAYRAYPRKYIYMNLNYELFFVFLKKYYVTNLKEGKKYKKKY